MLDNRRFRSPLAKSIAVVLGLAILTAIGLAVVGARPRGHTAAAGGVPSASTPAHTASGTFVRPPAIVATLRNVVVHWTGTGYYGPSGTGPDPYNGKVTTFDVWAQTDGTGAVVKYHAISRGPDDELSQEVVQDTSQTTRVFGAAYAPVLPKTPSGSANLCQAGPGGLNPSTSQSLLPLFTDPKALPGQGFHLAQAGVAAPGVPALTPLSGATPTHVYAATVTVDRYEKDVAAAPGQTNTHAVEIQADGRIVLVEGRLIDAQGSDVNVSRQTYGPVQVYALATVPASVFALSSVSQESCHA